MHREDEEDDDECDCDCEDDEEDPALFDADELGLDPERDDERAYGSDA